MVHRNAMFNLRHAQAMPVVSIEDTQITDLGGDLKAIDVLFRNHALIPTRTAMASVCSILLANKGFRVTMWGGLESHIQQLIQERENKRFLPGHRIPPERLA